MEIVRTGAILVPDKHWILLRKKTEQNRVLISGEKERIVPNQIFGSKLGGCSFSVFFIPLDD